MRKIQMAVVLLVLFVGGCSASLPPQGIVTAKRFEPAHTNTVLMPMTISDGNTSTTIFIPYTFFEPDRYRVTVEPYDADGNPLPVKQAYVRREVYGVARVGAWLNLSPDLLDVERARKVREESK